MNIACNLIYNDGGQGVSVGFEGRCSIQNIIYNVEFGSQRWCNQLQCSCKGFYDSGFRKNTAEQYPCTESTIFVNWEFNAGFTFNENRPLLMKQVRQNKLAILTTVFAGDEEKDRKVVGLFKIKDVLKNGNKVTSYKRYRLRLTLEEAKQVNFWGYYKNSNSSIRWSQPRFRYLEDARVGALLHDLIAIVKNDSNKSLLLDILENDYSAHFRCKPSVTSGLVGNIPHETALSRKYGPGGESEEHKKLKKHIAANPELIKLDRKEVKARLEHQYISGDCVDILFEPLLGRQNAIVEIELDHVLPGIHQAIKYKALRCAQLGIELYSNQVKAIVVAWKFREDEKELCKKYNIEYYEVRI